MTKSENVTKITSLKKYNDRVAPFAGTVGGGFLIGLITGYAINISEFLMWIGIRFKQFHKMELTG
jgi:uncharacterized membrane protein (Fun14 family)